MIIIPIFAIFILFIQMINKSQKIQINNKFRIKYSMIGLIVGPIVDVALLQIFILRTHGVELGLYMLRNLVEKKYLLQHF